MKWILLLVIFTVALAAQECSVIAQDSAGLIVVLKEKYGGYVTDTATAVSKYAGCFILTRRDGGGGWYPMVNWALVSTERIKHDKRETGTGAVSDNVGVDSTADAGGSEWIGARDSVAGDIR